MRRATDRAADRGVHAWRQAASAVKGSTHTGRYSHRPGLRGSAAGALNLRPRRCPGLTGFSRSDYPKPRPSSASPAGRCSSSCPLFELGWRCAVRGVVRALRRAAPARRLLALASAPLYAPCAPSNLCWWAGSPQRTNRFSLVACAFWVELALKTGSQCLCSASVNTFFFFLKKKNQFFFKSRKVNRKGLVLHHVWNTKDIT